MKKNNNIIFLILIAILEVFYSLHHMGYMSNNDGYMSIADGFRYTASSLYLPFMILIFIIYYLYIGRNEYNTMYVIKMKSKKYIWIYNIVQDIKYSFIYTIWISILGIVSFIFYNREAELINWMSYNSNYSLIGRGITSNIRFSNIVIKAYLIMYFQILVCLFFSRLIVWITNNRILLVIILSAVAISDIHPYYTAIFFSRFKYLLKDWGSTSFYSYRCILYLIIISVCLFLIGMAYSEHREFIDNDQI